MKDLQVYLLTVVLIIPIGNYIVDFSGNRIANRSGGDFVSFVYIESDLI